VAGPHVEDRVIERVQPILDDPLVASAHVGVVERVVDVRTKERVVLLRVKPSSRSGVEFFFLKQRKVLFQEIGSSQES
jgi:hypothetical protein